MHENAINVDVKINMRPRQSTPSQPANQKFTVSTKEKIFIGRAVTIDKATSCTNKTDKL